MERKTFLLQKRTGAKVHEFADGCLLSTKTKEQWCLSKIQNKS